MPPPAPGSRRSRRPGRAQVAALVREHCGARAAVGVERVNAGAALALRDEGFHLFDAQSVVERARAVKSDEELKCVRASIRATEARWPGCARRSPPG